MIRTVRGNLEASDLHVGVAVASWNQSITDRLLDGALERLSELGAGEVTVLHVPGALELPVAAKALADDGCDAVIAIGTIVKGETDHYEIVVRESTSGVGGVSITTGVPVANAILAVHDYSHAVDRAGQGDANKGREAADAAIETANAIKDLRSG